MLEIFQRKKGTIRRAAVESVRTYAVLRHKFPRDTEIQIAERMWKYWNHINEKHEDDIKRDLKLARLLDIKARRTDYNGTEDVVDIYFDILYIETGVSYLSKRAKKALDIFLDLLSQNGLALEGIRRDYMKRIKAMQQEAKKEKN